MFRLRCSNQTMIRRNLEPDKAHGHDMINIRMLSLCGKSICKLLDLIFQLCMKQRKFLTEWKKENFVPVHKKEDKQILKNYRSVSFLPICGKILQHLIYNNIFEYFLENN